MGGYCTGTGIPVNEYDVAIIGAGPAGLFCAIQAGAAGLRVLLIEKNREPARKLLLSGSGQCNITHAGDIGEFLTRYGSHGKFLKPALLMFGNDDLVRFFGARGLAMITREDGKLFPASLRAADVREHLVAACDETGVDLRCGTPVTGVSRDEKGFSVSTAENTFCADALVIATGGKSYPSTGSTGDGYRFARSLGQPITPVAPALTPVKIHNYPFPDLAGISLPAASFTLWRAGKKLGDYAGDLLLTHTGLSGPGILDASRTFAAGDELRIAFISRTGTRGADTLERTLKGANGTRPVRSVLADFSLPDRLARKIPGLAGIPSDMTCAHLSAPLRTRLAGLLTAFPFTIESPGDFTVAMATRGGVALESVNAKTLESRIVPGLYFCGEVLDIDGDTGGYNLQAAFSTGFLAARSIAGKAGKKKKP